MADVTSSDRLRKLLGEIIPDGGTAADTLFSDLDINDLLARHSGNVDDCLAEGWGMKAAALANLVDVVEGDQQRKLSQSYQAALTMRKHYLSVSADASSGRTRVRTINRGGFQG